MEMMTKGGSTVPDTVINAPKIPATRYPTRSDAFTAIAPGDDCAIAVRSIISSSSIQCSSSTNFLRISGIITKPPPNVQALSCKVDKNNFLNFL
jgi:hypothetical protein